MSKTSVHRIFLGVLALMPAALFAQQAAQPKTKAAQGKDRRAAAKEKKRQRKKRQRKRRQGMTRQWKLTQEPQQKTEEDGKLTSRPRKQGALACPFWAIRKRLKHWSSFPGRVRNSAMAPGVSTLLDDSRRPVDKEVFMRMLSYYEIRSETARPSGATTNGSTAAPANVAQRRKP